MRRFTPLETDPLENTKDDTPAKDVILPDPEPEKLPVRKLSILIYDNKQLIPLPDQVEIILGRTTPGQDIIPDIDLSDYQAYEAGVSRLHAMIQVTDISLTLVDLNSVNGTRLNGKKITPYIPQPLHHGDYITLGKLKIQVLSDGK